MIILYLENFLIKVINHLTKLKVILTSDHIHPSAHHNKLITIAVLGHTQDIIDGSKEIGTHLIIKSKPNLGRVKFNNPF
jgi:hypothetical protein